MIVMDRCVIHLIWSKAHLVAVGIQKLARRATLTFFLGQEKNVAE
jgi:hypothetical protein